MKNVSTIHCFAFISLFFAVNAFSQEKVIFIEPTAASAGEFGNRASKLMVYGTVISSTTIATGTSIYLALGDASEPTPKARYSTVLTAISLGKKIRLRYWTPNSSNDPNAWIDEYGTLSQVKME